MTHLAIDLTMRTAILIQSLMIIIGSMIVLQNVLKNHSFSVRLAFNVFPIGAALEILELIYAVDETYISLFVINLVIIATIFWLWNQKTFINDMEQVLIKNSPKESSIVVEIKAILSCFALWILRKINKDDLLRCAVCEQILPHMRKSPRDE